MLARLMFAAVNFSARRGLREELPEEAPDAASDHDGANPARKKLAARSTGVRGETYAYWYLRRNGYTMIARNYTFPGMKGEIDMVGYDGETLAFIEVKTRSVAESPAPENSSTAAARPAAEFAVNHEKRRNLSRMAKQFLRTRRLDESFYRFDILAIDARPAARPEIRLHKGAFTAAR